MKRGSSGARSGEPNVVIFDLDGTLLDAYRAIHTSLNHTLGEFGYPGVSQEKARRTVGAGDLNFIRAFFKGSEVTAALKIYRKDHQASLVRYAKRQPGAIKVLKTLRKRGFFLAVATNRPRKFSMILLRHLNLEKYFSVILCGKGPRDIKPQPTMLLRIMRLLKARKENVWYVGDMVIDVRAGHNAGVRTIAVAGGSSTRAELRKAKPYKIAGNLTEVLKIV
ncbi:MAG: HAD family hydrolase [Candidatus Omnitrophota bacterium]